MWGATKRRPSVKQVVFITHIANPHRPIYPFRSFLPFYLPASPLPVPSRHIILTAVMVYPSPRSTRQRQPKPTISAVLCYYSLQHPNTEPPPQHVQTPRKITLFDNHLPAHLVTRIVPICPSNTSPNAIPRYPPAARPSSPTNKYQPADYS